MITGFHHDDIGELLEIILNIDYLEFWVSPIELSINLSENTQV